MQPHTPRPKDRQPSDSAPGQDIARALTSLKNKFPASVIWFGRATGHWWAMAGAGRLFPGVQDVHLGDAGGGYERGVHCP